MSSPTRSGGGRRRSRALMPDPDLNPNSVILTERPAFRRWMYLENERDQLLMSLAEEQANNRGGGDSDGGGGYKRARVPASSEAILGLPEVSSRDAGRAECAVCLQDFDAEEKLRMMPCSHAFHQDCIFPWLRRNGVCPLCRHKLPSTEEATTEEQEEEVGNDDERFDFQPWSTPPRD